VIKKEGLMMKLAQRVTQIKPSATLAINAKAKALKKAGAHIVNFGVGEPDFDTPQYIQEAADRAMRGGQTRYTAVGGIDELKDAVLQDLRENYGIEYRRENVLVSCGGKHALYNLFQAMVESGDEVVIPAPYWVSYPDMVALTGATPVFVPCLEANGFKMLPEQLERAITPKTRLLIFNSPSNPTGVHYRRTELEALAEVLLRHEQVIIVSDDIYYRILFSGHEWANLAMVSEGLRERTFIVNGVSKTYCMTGWRIGYLIGDARVVEAATDIQSQSTSNAATISQFAAAAALQGDRQVVTDMVQVFEARCRYVMERLAELPGVTCPTPAGAFYAFPNCSSYYGKKSPTGTIKSSLDLSEYLMESAHVAVVPGSAFGEDHCIRISYALSMEDLKEGFDRLAKALQALS
jgi:aspartate aminotransferase